ncbi:MAG TPA: NADH-ubiquinone oxidoreductase-F iron-sulfur binding region domain-containing protein [Dehalococcoidia bacterium]
MPTLAELTQQAEPARRRIEALDKTRIAVGIDTSSIAKGALETLQALRDEVARRNMDVVVDQVGGNGLSFANPVVIVQTSAGSKVLYQQVSAEDAPAFIESVLVKGEDYDRWTLGAFHGRPGAHVPMMDDHPWWSIQSRKLMQDMGEIDPENVDEALVRGAYVGLERAMSMGQEEVIAEVIASTLGGRGGSYFPTGRKWDFLRTSTTHPKNMVCNADEGDPGAWLNRMTMECDPHALIEGMMIGGWATGAYHGYIYIREEYPLAFERMQKAVDQAYERGILGKNVLGRDWSFDMHVVRGAGSYVCGEESGLIASIEDARGMPKIRPPFPAASGVFGEGSNVNNVESYHTATWVMRYGVAEWKKTGTERNAGSKMFCVSGDVNRVGCFELPFGTHLRELLDVCGGGVPEARSVKAIQVGGPLTGLTPDFYLDLGMEAEVYRENKLGSLGGGGFVFLDQGACVINMLSQLHWFIEDESCGRCTTCHGGTQRMVEILRRIQKGGGRESDIGKLRLICDTLRNANCQHGQLAPVTILHALDWFMDDLEEHIFDRRCRASACKGLVEYEITSQEGDLAKAADYCPTNAIVQEEGNWLIDQDLCVKCHACKEIAPSAVTIVDRFEAGLGPAPELISVQPAER